ncbi:MAG: signal recognition particle-docking protein FtsY [bacterium]
MLNKLRDGLARTRNTLFSKVESIVRRGGGIDENFYEQLEASLLLADTGLATTVKIIERVRDRIRDDRIRDREDALAAVRISLEDILKEAQPIQLSEYTENFTTIMFAGVNGSGKTTTIAKLSHRYKSTGTNVMIAACDTFRAAAGEQLQIWADRLGVPIVRQKEGADPSAVLYDAITAARARTINILLADTAGRLHTSVNLMAELKKMRRIAVEKAAVPAFYTYLVLDATLGQNSFQQVKLFNDALKVDAVILTKLDGTAKGGIVFSIINEWKIPIAYIGVGESLDDLLPFSPNEFAKAIL